MADQTEQTLTADAQPNKVSKLKYWGLGILGIVLVISGLVLSVSGGTPALFAGMTVSGIGLAFYAKAKGRSIAWCALALLPLIGPVVGLFIEERVSPNAEVNGKGLSSNLGQPSIPASQCSKARRRWGWKDSLGLVAIIVVLAAIAIPNFVLMEPKARQSEARTNLGGIYVAEKAYFEKHKRYGTFEEIGYVVPGNNRYTYRIDVSGKPGTMIPARNGSTTPDNTVVHAGFSATGFTATATGNIDNDPTIDQWHVNDAKQGLDKADADDVTN